MIIYYGRTLQNNFVRTEMRVGEESSNKRSKKIIKKLACIEEIGKKKLEYKNY